MATPSEDLPPHETHPPLHPSEEVDFSSSSSSSGDDEENGDHAPDYTAILSTTTNTPQTPPHQNQPLIPRRGTKDFAPNPTTYQQTQLASARAAMDTALRHTRSHHPRGYVAGRVVWRSEETSPAVDEEKENENKSKGDGSRGAGNERDKGVEEGRGGRIVVRVPGVKGVGKIFATMGRGVSGGGETELEAEEALWLVESGRIDVYWPVERGEENGAEEGEGGLGEGEEEPRVPMSLQAAYATFLGDPQRTGGLTAERYAVYAGLKRSGFIVRRAEGFSGRGRGRGRKKEDATLDVTHVKNRGLSGEAARARESGVFAWLYARILDSPLNRDVGRRRETEGQRAERMRTGPLVRPGLYRSYGESYFHSPHHSIDTTNKPVFATPSTPFLPSPFPLLPTQH